MDNPADTSIDLVANLKMEEALIKKLMSWPSEDEQILTGQEPPKMDPFITRYKFNAQRSQKRKYFYGPNGMPHHSSHSPLKNLKSIHIQDLRVNELAKGSYLLLRVLETPIDCGGIMTVVEDQTGDVFIFYMFMYIHFDYRRCVEEELPIGTVFALKEPSLISTAGVNFVISCSTSADMVRIDRSHLSYEYTRHICWKNRITEENSISKDGMSALEWKTVGNKFYCCGKLMEAVEAYSVALNMSKEADLTLILHLNLSAAHLVAENYEQTLHHAYRVLESKKDNFKALYRTGRAHYQLRQYNEAKVQYEKSIRIQPSNSDAILGMERCIQRLEEEIGNINVQKLFLTSIGEPFTPIECGNHVGPVEVSPIPGKGRGMLASRDITPGTLLVLSKAFQAEFNSIFIPFKMVKNLPKLINKTVQAIFKNPKSFGKSFHELSSNDAVMDNCSKLFCDEENKSDPIVDLNRVVSILRTNCIKLHSSTCGSVPSVTGRESNGIFFIPSYFNHSCLPNSYCQIYNDVVVIRAITFVPKGEELTISYHSGTEGYQVRNRLFKRRGFQCNCELCQLDRSEPREIHERRDALKKECQNILANQRTNEDIARLIKEMECSYSRREKLRVELSQMLMGLVLFASQEDIEKKGFKLKAMKSVNKALNCLGLSCDILLQCAEDDRTYLPKDAVICYDYLMEVILIPVISLMLDTGDVPEMKKWLKVLIMIERVFIGGDSDTLKVKTEGYFPLKSLLVKSFAM